MGDLPPLRKLVVVFGSGRSGTSLLTQLLANIGLSVSENLLGPHMLNPKGFFEDIDIVEFNKNIIAQAGLSPHLPVPENWLGKVVGANFFDQAKDLLKRKLDSSDRTLVLKDPRFSFLLPFWSRVFKSQNVLPIFILSVRNPASTIDSLCKAAPNLIFPEIAELIWLSRTCDAIWNVSGNCFIAHYEEVIEQTEIFHDAIVNYLRNFDVQVSLSGSYSHNNIVNSSYNRSSGIQKKLGNPYIQSLYIELLKCKHANFDRNKLMEKVSECRVAINAFSGWYLHALRQQGSLSNAKRELTKCKSDLAKTKKAQILLEEEFGFVKNENQRFREMISEIDQLSLALEQLRNV